MSMTFCAPCIFGLEGICAHELKYLGISGVRAENGRVLFEGDWRTLARANINSRYAERIQILLAEFRAESFDELFEGTAAVPWEEYIGMSDAFPVKGRCLSSRLMSVPNCQKIIKKAVVKRLSSRYMLSWFEETGAVHQIQFLIMKDRVSILLDTSGAGLHKRGYRADSNDAPIKETLAAAMAELARVRPGHFVCDPMCGSGTILIEAAMKARGIAPGLNRYFAGEKWSCAPKEALAEELCLKLAIELEQDFKEGFAVEDNLSWYVHFFETMYDHRDYLKIILSRHTSVDEKLIIGKLFPAVSTEEHYFYIGRGGALFSILKEWYLTGMKESPDEMGSLCNRFFSVFRNNTAY